MRTNASKGFFKPTLCHQQLFSLGTQETDRCSQPGYLKERTNSGVCCLKLLCSHLPISRGWVTPEGGTPSLVKNPVVYLWKSTSSKGGLIYTVWCLGLECSLLDGRKDTEEYLWEIFGNPFRICQPHIFIKHLVSKMRLWAAGDKESERIHCPRGMCQAGADGFSLFKYVWSERISKYFFKVGWVTASLSKCNRDHSIKPPQQEKYC